MTKPQRVAFIGTGLMGVLMSFNLMKVGYDLTVWNRTADRTTPLTAAGAQLAVSPADAVRDAAFIVTMVADGFVSSALVDDPDMQNALSPGAIWIDTSSTKPKQARAQAETLSNLGVAHLDAPVSGGTKGAADGSLAILVGGAEHNHAGLYLELKPRNGLLT